ncbi:unnamed protein product [Pleuronectes platessa]|uniref:Receptor ligand binding region domain-containing protein n=1 Tax=Pleuronectes platessa TaxID=8262 RepID=A0A9N7TLD9_PLEPL|nr:unnamed protein product [Pleuronectes platessa]
MCSSDVLCESRAAEQQQPDTRAKANVTDGWCEGCGGASPLNPLQAPCCVMMSGVLCYSDRDVVFLPSEVFTISISSVTSNDTWECFSHEVSRRVTCFLNILLGAGDAPEKIQSFPLTHFSHAAPLEERCVSEEREQKSPGRVLNILRTVSTCQIPSAGPLCRLPRDRGLTPEQLQLLQVFLCLLPPPVLSHLFSPPSSCSSGLLWLAAAETSGCAALVSSLHQVKHCDPPSTCPPFSLPPTDVTRRPRAPEPSPGRPCQTPPDSCHWSCPYPMVAPRPALSLLLAVLACTGPARPSPPLLLRPRERERDSGGVNIAVVHSGSSLLPETAVVGGTGVVEPGPGLGPGLGSGPGGGGGGGGEGGAGAGGRGGGRGVTDTASMTGVAAMASYSSSLASLSLAALVGETVMTPSGQANVIYLAVNESSPGSLLLQLCELLATTPLQGLVFEEERPPPPNRAPLAPMLEFVSAQTGVPVVAVGGGASLGREPQETGSIYLQFTCSTALQLEVIFEVLEEYDWTAFSVVTTRHHGYEDFLAMVEGMTDGSFIGWEKNSVVILNVTDDPGGARTKRLLKDHEAQDKRTAVCWGHSSHFKASSLPVSAAPVYQSAEGGGRQGPLTPVPEDERGRGHLKLMKGRSCTSTSEDVMDRDGALHSDP